MSKNLKLFKLSNSNYDASHNSRPSSPSVLHGYMACKNIRVSKGIKFGICQFNNILLLASFGFKKLSMITLYLTLKKFQIKLLALIYDETISRCYFIR